MNDQQFMGADPTQSAIPPPPPATPQPTDSQQMGWAPSAGAPSANPAQVAPGPFDANSMQPTADTSGFQPIGQPQSNAKTWILIVILIISLVAGGLVLASWQGWISLGGIEKLWGGGQQTTEQTEKEDTTPVETPQINATDAQRKTDLANLKTALKAYYQTKQSYPIAETVQKTSEVDSILNVLVPDYITKLPVDPMSPTYYYGYKSNGQTFELTSILEDKTDPSGITVGTYYLYKVTDLSVETPTSSTSTSGGSITTDEDTEPTTPPNQTDNWYNE